MAFPTRTSTSVTVKACAESCNVAKMQRKDKIFFIWLFFLEQFYVLFTMILLATIMQIKDEILKNRFLKLNL